MLMLDSEILKKVNSWINGTYDHATKRQLQEMLDKKAYGDLTDAFYKDLEFGTGGIRGIMGPGTNRVNKYTIGMATQGLANYLNNTYPNEKISIAIAHDSRNNSDELANITADVFSANGIYVYYFEALRPTPQLSFAIRELGCKSGVMLTASHNPKEYNGYKAYGPDGGQVVTPYDEEILAEVRKIQGIDAVRFNRINENIEIIDASFDEKYQDAVLSKCINTSVVKNQSDLKIVFSPIHGTGAVSVPPILRKMGFKNVIEVEEQMIPDGNFPTVVYPNPEEEEAMTMALDKAKEVKADIVMATDPDADRVGIAIQNPEGDYILLNGNQTAAILFEYVLSAWQEAGKIQGNEYIVKTIVTTYLLDKIAETKKIECFNTLTGFKHMGALMTKFEGEKQFIIGGEESYGYLIGDHARDKDAVVSCALLAEMCAYYKDNNKSLYDALVDLYLKYGLYLEKLISIKKEGKKGEEEIKAMMNGFRSSPPKALGGAPVVSVKDYQTKVATNLMDGSTETIDLPKSNVLQFITEDGSIISARPSGTEPKIKFYCSVNTKLENRSEYMSKAAELSNKIDALLSDLGVS